MEVNKSENILSSDLSYFHRVGENPLVYRTLGQQLSLIAKEYGEQEAFVFAEEGKRITYNQLLSDADRLAAGYQCLGLQKGDRIGILAPNVSTWPLAMFAAARAGLILVHLNPMYSAQEIESCLQKVTAKVLVTAQNIGSMNYYDKLLEIIPELESCHSGNIHSKRLPSLTTIIIDSEKFFVGTHRLNDIMNLPTMSQINRIEHQQQENNPDNVSCIIFTSGFTGNPKAVQLTNFGVVNTGCNMNIVKMTNSTICMPLPFCHVYASVIISIGSLSHHATVVVPSSLYDPEKNLLAIWKEKCNFIFGVPKMFMDLISKQKKLKLDIKDVVGVTGGASCPPELLKQIKMELNLKEIKFGLGMTEYGGISFGTRPQDRTEEILDTVGCVTEHLEVKVIDGDGKLVPFGTPGELCVRGYSIMIGYWGDQEKTKAVLGSDGWLRTGDYFILQPNGYGQIIGRLGDIITRGNEKIFPKEIENLLVTCPSIAEAYVVGIPDEHWGQNLCAFIRLQDGIQDFSSNDLYEFCQGKIPSSNIPPYVRIIEDFPKTISGKVKKLELQQLFFFMRRD